MSSKICFAICLGLIFLNEFAFGKCWVSNSNPIFESTPQFHIQTTKPIVDKIHWEISDNAEFDWISPELQNVSASSNEIILSEETQKLLIPRKIYYFRFKTEFYNKCSSWSEPFNFSLGTPKVDCKEYNWKKSPLVDDHTWNNVQPYLLPSNHPLKSKLDQIFLKMRATANSVAMTMAGFKSLDVWRWDKVYVAKHPDLKGYLIKAYLDDHLFMDDKTLVNRIIGAENLRSGINAYGYQSFLKVPHKWLYPLPDSPSTLPGLHPKHFILIVEDMDIVDKQKNEKMYHNSMSEKQLAALYVLINNFGLADSIYIYNIPFSKDRKIAFVDTERHGLWPVNFEKLTPSLNSKMKKCWQSFQTNR